jgi:hypothetical protein
MLESIIQFINLKLSLLNYFEKRHCLTTLVKNDDGLIYPAEYITNGDFDAIDFDGYDGVSYMRVNGEVDIARTDQQYTPKPRLEVSFPLKLVYAVRKDKLTQDDAYSWDRVRASIAKQLETDSKDLANTLDADLVQISTSSYMSDTKEIWDEETAETGQFQPKFEVVFGSMEVTVTVTTRAECIPAECDDFESDILKSFDFCSTTVQGRLTPEQITCLTDWLCGSGDPVTIQINGVTYTTAEAGSTFDQQIVNTDDDAVGTAANPSVIADSTIQINGVNAGSAIAEGTYNQEVVNSNDDAVGTAANPSVVGDSTITINGDSLGATGNVIAEGSLNIEVNLDGNPSGSWDGDSWEVTSAACPDATVNANSTLVANVPSGDTLDIDVHDTLDNNVGTVVSTTEIEIADSTIQNNATPTWTDSIEAEGTLTLAQAKALDSDGVTDLLADYIPSTSGYMFTCTPQVKDLSLFFNVKSGDSVISTITITSNSAGTIDTVDDGGLTGLTIEVNSIVVTTPFTLANTDILDISFTTASSDAIIELSGTYT